MRRILIFILLFSFVSTLPMEEADARRRRRHRTQRAKIINEKKLYERIGGAKALTLIVDEWVRLNLADPKIAPMFQATTAQPEKLARFRRQLNDQLCELADGPCSYKGTDMKKAHQGFAIGEELFLVFAQNLFSSMQKFNVPEREKNEMLGRLGELRQDVVSETPAGT